MTHTPERGFKTRVFTVGKCYEHGSYGTLTRLPERNALIGVEGEMCCRGYNVMKGYYKNWKQRRKLLIKMAFSIG